MAAFPEVNRIPFEGPESRNPLAFRHYNADEVVEGKSMREHFRFSVAYWHTMRGARGRPVRAGPTAFRPWEERHGRRWRTPINRVRVAFEFIEKLGCDLLLRSTIATWRSGGERR